MYWNWQNPIWPNFNCDDVGVVPLEQRFLQSARAVISAVRHFDEVDSSHHKISNETSAIKARHLAGLDGFSDDAQAFP
jgi:Fic family protein